MLRWCYSCLGPSIVGCDSHIGRQHAYLTRVTGPWPSLSLLGAYWFSGSGISAAAHAVGVLTVISGITIMCTPVTRGPHFIRNSE